VKIRASPAYRAASASTASVFVTSPSVSTTIWRGSAGWRGC
jgi:hypothetical protein